MNRENIKIEHISLENVDEVSKREVLVELNTGSVVHICVCQESYEQYGGTYDELWVTLPVAEHYNDWLHGTDDLSNIMYSNEYECEE